MFKEFKEFAIKGSVIDMAVGFIIGAASGKVVTSMVNDIIMPPLGYFLGKVKFSDLKATILHEKLGQDGEVIQPEIVISYGNFLQVTVDFLIMAVVLFLVVKLFNMLKRRAEDEKVTSVPTPRDIELLAKINDSLAQINENTKPGN
ncbi:MAG: large-conductance mechanosensitive channel [Cyclobacteriaceae bacterium]|nr:MAG: large-conductance mechanosensitive channel [Cyclobacteriaceae bacterium]